MAFDFFSGRKKGDMAVQQKTVDPTLEKVRSGTQSILRKIQFDQLVKQGLGPREALKRIGVRVPIERRISPMDIQKVVQTGALPKKRF